VSAAPASVAAARGRLIAFEGIDGCGKSTQAARCAGWLAERARPRAVKLLREPGGTPCGEAVRAVLLGQAPSPGASAGAGARPGAEAGAETGAAIGAQAEMLLYMAARAELYEREVLPALAVDGVVLLDRSHYSTAAYQGAGLHVDQALIRALAAAVTRGRWPDRVLLFDLPVALAQGRRGARAADRIERRGAEYFERVAEGYRALARAEPERFTVIDARPDADTVFAAVQAALADVL
jgi:dTMP kinase